MNPAASPAPPTVLVVEDDELVRRVVVKKLTRLGCHVVEARTGAEALQACPLTAPPRLVVSDLVLPDMNGRTLVEKIKTVHPDAKALFMSGYSHEFLAGRGVLNPEDDFIEKTMLHVSLVERVEALLRR